MYKKVLKFWFEDIKPAQWWKKDPEFDQKIKDEFLELHQQANLCELADWRKAPYGRLAEVIILDQFSRNIYRDTPLAFASDPLALALAQEAVATEADQALSNTERSFLYMPYMHSESPRIHQWAVALYKANGIEGNYQFELKHKEIIDQFARYPHRNKILGRTSTEEETVFLTQPESSF